MRDLKVSIKHNFVFPILGMDNSTMFALFSIGHEPVYIFRKSYVVELFSNFSILY